MLGGAGHARHQAADLVDPAADPLQRLPGFDDQLAAGADLFGAGGDRRGAFLQRGGLLLGPTRQIVGGRANLVRAAANDARGLRDAADGGAQRVHRGVEIGPQLGEAVREILGDTAGQLPGGQAANPVEQHRHRLPLFQFERLGIMDVDQRAAGAAHLAPAVLDDATGRLKPAIGAALHLQPVDHIIGNARLHRLAERGEGRRDVIGVEQIRPGGHQIEKIRLRAIAAQTAKFGRPGPA